MKASVVFSKKNKNDDKGYLFMLYRDGSRKKKISLDFSITKDDYEKYFAKSHGSFAKNKKYDFTLINNRIAAKMAENPFEIKKDSRKFYVLEYMNTRKQLKDNFSTQNTYSSSFNMFRKFLVERHKVMDIDFSDVDNDFILEMQSYYRKAGLQPSTIRFYMNNYSAVYNAAIKNDVYIGKNPFSENKLKVTGKPKKILTEEDVLKLLAIRKGDLYFLESRMFLFSLFGNGLRCSDMMLMKYGNIRRDYIEYDQLKTGIPLKVNYSSEVIIILMDLLGIIEYRNKLEKEVMIHKPDFLPYKLAKRRMMNQVSKNKVNEDYESYYGYQIKPNDKESKVIIDELVRVEQDIDVACKNKIFQHVRKLDAKDLLFKDFIKSECYRDFDKKTAMNEEQFKTYKTRYTSYNAKLKRLAKFYKLSIEDITTHVSRFTFTNVLLEIKGINLNDIRIALGHSNLATTQKYLQVGFDFKKSDLVNSEMNYRYRR